MRISDDTLAQAHRGNIEPIWPPIVFFYLILQEFYDFCSGTWHLRYLMFLRMQFLDKCWVSAIFLVFRQQIEPQTEPNL